MTTQTVAPVRPEGQKPLTIKNYLSFAAGDAANNIAFTMSGMFLVLYYTNVVGLSGAVIGTMFLVLRFVDAFTDLVMGRIIDAATPGKLGKFRPLIRNWFLPLLITNWAMYAAKLFFPDQSPLFYTVYMYVTYFLMGSVFYTIVNIAYGSMAPSLTQVPTERAKLAGFRMYGSAAMILLLSWVIAPLIKAYQTDPVGLQNALALAVGLISVLAAVLYVLTVAGTMEQVARDPKPVTMKESFGALRVNRPLQILAASSVLLLLGITVLQTLGSYIALYVQNDATYIAINQTAQTLALFLVSPFIPLMVRTIGKRIAYILVACFLYVGILILWFAPLEQQPWLGSVGFFVLGLGVFGVNTLMWALEADCVEFGEWKIGARTEGTTYAVFSFCRKMGQALGGFLGGFALVWAGFNAAEVSQGIQPPDEVGRAILFWALVFVVGATALGQLVMAAYPLSEAKYQEIVQAIALRRGKPAEALEEAGLKPSVEG